MVVDLGNAYYSQRALQASADAAALAGAQDINAPVAGTAKITASSYSAATGGKNTIGNLSVTMSSTLKCLTSTGVSCSGSDNANAIVVNETATVPTIFAKAFGLTTIPIAATSTASSKGGKSKALDVEVVIDTTPSMNSTDPNCSGLSQINCALQGLRQMLLGLSPSNSAVGITVFPGLANSTQAQYEYDCASSPTGTAQAYNSNPYYTIIPLDNSFRINDQATTLFTSSTIVKAARGGATGCQQGVDILSPSVSTYYANAITAAQAFLVNNGRTNSQKVIVLLSDGDANTLTNGCHNGITAAKAATTAGTWVFVIAYGAKITGGCANDTPYISPCDTLKQMASDSSKFFSTGTGVGSCVSAVNSTTNLQQIFQAITNAVNSPRIIPNGLT